MMGRAFWVCVICCLPLTSASADEDARRAELGRAEKLRILVDKVMQPQAGWKTEEWMIQATTEAGFNVFSPRAGFDDLEAVKRVSEWCVKYGIYHMPWMRGSLDVPLNDKAADGKRLVWASGGEQPLWSVNSDQFWEWTTRYIVEYARLSVENKALMGVFLDYENYATGAEDNLYSLSYDDVILAKYAAGSGVEIPKLEPAKRKMWLDEQHLHERFADFQVNYWRERCRALRKAVDALNPAFQFCIYPAPGTPFMVEATYPEWATDAAPLILADACTYGRPSRFLPEQESLEINRQHLLERMETPKKAGIPFIYTGGIDPVVHGADPEFSGKNAVMCSEVTGGYWIFYEGPTYTKQDHKDYWKWFSWANQKIAQGDFDAQHQSRETPESFFDGVFDQVDGKTTIPLPEFTPEKRLYPQAKLRGENLLLVAGRKGIPVETVLKHEPVSNYTAPLMWELRGPDRAMVASGTIAQAETGAVGFTAEKDGVYIIAASAGSCAYAVVSSNVPLAIFAGAKAAFIGVAPRLYFSVPKGTKSFAIKVESSGQETVRVNVFDPQGKQIATGQTTPQNGKIEVAVQCADEDGGVFSLETARADVGVVEDYALTLDPKISLGFSMVPEHVFKSPESR